MTADALPAHVLQVAGGLVAGAYLLTLYRLVRGPTASDRVVALDLLAALTLGAIALHAMAARSAASFEVALVLALVGFLGTVAFATYLARRVP